MKHPVLKIQCNIQILLKQDILHTFYGKGFSYRMILFSPKQ